MSVLTFCKILIKEFGTKFFIKCGMYYYQYYVTIYQYCYQYYVTFAKSIKVKVNSPEKNTEK